MNLFVKNLVEEFAGSSKDWKPGDRIVHPKHGLVEIVRGSFWGTRGVSNFWYWKKVFKNGKLSNVEYCGYGWL